MKKLIIILTLANLSSFCFAQDELKVSDTNTDLANAKLQSYYPTTTVTDARVPEKTVLLGFVSMVNPYDQNEVFGDKVNCETALIKKLVTDIEAKGYVATPQDTGNPLEQLVWVGMDIAPGVYSSWLIKYDYFVMSYKDKENRSHTDFVCYGYDLNMDYHKPMFDKTKRIGENGKIITPKVTYFPPK